MARTSPVSRLHCIVRIDSKKSGQHSWQVKIVRTENSFHRSFSDSKFGSKQAALRAAIVCRDRELRKRPPSTSYDRAIRPKKTTSSGIVGVRRGQKVVSKGKRSWTYPCWIATGTPVAGGKPTTRYFPFDRHGGSTKAKAAALKQRRAWEKSLKASVASKSA